MTIELTDAERTRYESKYDRSGDCLLWNDPLDRDGYGSFYFRGATRRAHRFAWAIANGEIPEGMVVNHACRNRACVNHQHLQLVTVRENALKDSSSPAYVNSQKMTCPDGHPYDATITWSGKTQRICTVCDRKRRAAAKARRYHAGKREVRI